MGMIKMATQNLLRSLRKEKKLLNTDTKINKDGSVDVFSFDLASLKQGGFFMYIMLYNVWKML